jgi:hypothetical protein
MTVGRHLCISKTAAADAALILNPSLKNLAVTCAKLPQVDFSPFTPLPIFLVGSARHDLDRVIG